MPTHYYSPPPHQNSRPSNIPDSQCGQLIVIKASWFMAQKKGPCRHAHMLQCYPLHTMSFCEFLSGFMWILIMEVFLTKTFDIFAQNRKKIHKHFQCALVRPRRPWAACPGFLVIWWCDYSRIGHYPFLKEYCIFDCICFHESALTRNCFHSFSYWP